MDTTYRVDQWSNGTDQRRLDRMMSPARALALQRAAIRDMPLAQMEEVLVPLVTTSISGDRPRRRSAGGSSMRGMM
jgi:hypothetical protein